jgi:hypothetical protein
MALLSFPAKGTSVSLFFKRKFKKGFYRSPLLLFVFLWIAAVNSYAQTSLFQSNQGSNVRENDGSGLELGMRFRSTQNGFITAIRYYKPAGTTGTHTGHLWTNSGTLLASVTFTGESSSGWQQASLGSPVSITANTTYVVSYFSPSGDYAVTNPYFTTAVTNGPLRGLANGEDGANGVYRYTSTSAFPNNNYGTSNYWVDVVFTVNAGPDVTPPLVTSVSPVNGAIDINTGTTLDVVFNEAMNSSTITSSTIELRSGSTVVSATVTYNTTSLSATLTPSSPLSPSTIYTATVKGGASGVKDAAGNALASDYTWSFTTASPPPNEGNGGPILVISAASNPFSRYTVEILRAEGLNEFMAMDISSVTSAVLNNYDVVILGEMTVTAEQVTMLTNWVNAGGKLIAFRPSALLTPLMGLSAASGTLSDRYLLINTTSGPGVGIVNQTIQYHGPANLHTLNGATSIATLYSSATTATSNPAVTTINVGSNGGKAIAFTYDLARSIVYTRQGNPALAGKETDNEAPQVIRPDDLFFPDYLDMNKVAIPQADEQQRLLANIIIQSNLAKKPLPRFWYMPKDYKAAVVFALDDHGTQSGTKDIFDKMIANSPAGCSIDDWECYRATSWFYVGIPLTSAQANTYHSQGFEMGTHVQNGCRDFSSFADLNSYYNTQFQQFRNAYPGLPLQTTHRFHCLVWSDWLTQAKVELSRGVRLSMDYYYWPPSWINGRPGLFTGSGIPMRYADLDGSIIDVYQAPSQLVNENGINYTTDINTLLDNALGSQGYYGFFGAHDDYRDVTFSNVAISAAKSRNVPIISAKQMLTWLDGRNGSYFGNMTWNGNQLTVPITALSGARNLKCMLPYNSATGGTISSITRNGSALSFTTQTIKGIQYAFFDVAIGTSTYVATYTGGSGTAPSVTTHPVAQTVCAGNEVTFTSAVSGTPTPTVQWQVSTNGTSWSNISGATNSTLTLSVTTSDNNKRYRAVWSNSQGTVNSNAAILTVNALPSAPLVNVVNNCGNSVLTANGVTGTLLWNTGATTPSITVVASGTYTVTQTVNGCTSAAGSAVAVPNSTPSAPVVNVINNCGNSVLTANGATGTLLWSTGETTSSITVTTSGTYTVTQTINGCTSAAGSGVAAPKTVPGTPVVNVSDNCGNSVLSATGITGSLLWSNGATTSSITVTTPGTYTVTQTLNGCVSAAGSGVASPKAVPSAPVVNVVNDCGNSVLTATGVTGSLLWSNGATTSSITVTTPGTYTVTQTLNGCVSAAGSGVASPKAVPSAPVVNVVNDCGNSVLTATGVTGSLLWSNGATTSSITITDGGTYTVTQTVNGCTSAARSGVASPKAVPSAPVVNVVNDCGSSVLTATGVTGSLLWSNGATTTSITVTTPGTYTVVQTVDGCISQEGSATAAPKIIPPAPTVSVTNNCGSSVLTAGNYTGTLLWSTSETTPSITVTTGGIYTVTQTIGDCISASGTATAAPKAIPVAPIVLVSNNCGSSVLTAGNYTGTLLWSTGATTPSITVTEGGLYSVTQTVNGCTGAAGTAVAEPIVLSAAPSVSVVNNCNNSVLTASNYTGTLLWSTGATTSSITVTSPGVYTVAQVIDGCPGYAASITAAPGSSTIAAPTVSVVDNCGSSVLTAGNYTGTLLWSTGETSSSITVTTPGLYTVTQIIDGCSSAQGSGTATPSATPSAPVISVTDNCGSSVLTASGYTGSLLWSTGESSESITVTTAGTYTVTQTVNGCTSASSSAEALPKPAVAAPSISVVNNCDNSVITVTDYTGSLLWSTGETSESITVIAAGTYTVTQTVNGCVSEAASIMAEPTGALIGAPVITVENNCGNSVLTASGYTGSLLWSTGETSESITVTTEGTYSVVQIVESCQGIAGSILVTPKLIPTAPVVTVENNCGSSILTASNYSGSLLWSTGETTPSITVTTDGTYTVTQTINGCTSNSGNGVASPAPAITAPTVTVVDNCGSSILTANEYTGTLLWSTGQTTPSIVVTTGGTYTVTQSIGQCVSEKASAVASPKAIPAVPSVSVVNNCESSTLTASGYSGALLWSTGETTSSIAVTTAGTYTVTQTVDGCMSNSGSGLAAPGTGSASSKPVITANGPTTFCEGGSVTLTSSLASGNLWSTGATTQSIVVTSSGSYTVQDANGGLCAVASDPVIVTVTPTPAGTISVLSASLCENTAAIVTFNAAPGAGPGPYNLVINGVTYNNVISGIPFVTTSVALPGTSLWPNNPTPGYPLTNDGQPLEVGMKFRVSANGVIRSIRFYKGSNNDASTYTLKLYQNSNRSLLASVTFSNRTATGWQTVPLPTPISVTAGTTYVVSYYSPSGNYANNENYFTTARTNGGITGLANGTDGSNGVYRYGSGGGFPTNTYQASNYWVDVVYATSATLTLNLTSVTNTATNCTVSGNLSSVNLQVTACPAILARSVSAPETIVEKEIIPKKLELGQNHPNPFESRSLIDFSLPETGRVKLVMYDLNGRVVSQLLNEVRDAGTYTIPVSKDGLKGGIYYYKIEFKGEMIVRKMMIL